MFSQLQFHTIFPPTLQEYVCTLSARPRLPPSLKHLCSLKISLAAGYEGDFLKKTVFSFWYFQDISFYLMQHSPPLRSKFWIRIKKTRSKIGTWRISHTSSTLHWDSRELHKDLFEGNSMLSLTRFRDWVELLTVVLNVAQRFCFCLYLCLARPLSLNLCMILLLFVILLLNSVFSLIQQARLYIDVNNAK